MTTETKQAQWWDVKYWHVTTDWPDDGSKAGGQGYPRIRAGNRTIACGTDKSPVTEASLKRAVACARACAGINPEAVPELLQAVQAFVRDRATCPTNNGVDLEAWEAIRAALAKARS